MGGIIRGFKVPLKRAHIEMFTAVLMPLHKIGHVVEFHNALVCCIVEFLQKDALLVRPAIGALLRFWPKISCGKNLLFLHEIEELYNTHPKQARTMIGPIIDQLGHCMSSPYYEIVERALQVWKTPSFRDILLDTDLGPGVYRTIYKSLHHPNHDQFTWYPDANDTIMEAIEELIETNQQWWDDAAKEVQQTTVAKEVSQDTYRQDMFAQIKLLAKARHSQGNHAQAQSTANFVET